MHPLELQYCVQPPKRQQYKHWDITCYPVDNIYEVQIQNIKVNLIKLVNLILIIISSLFNDTFSVT
jgi:hypothetical protein